MATSCAERRFTPEEHQQFQQAQTLYRNRKFDAAEKLAHTLWSKKPQNAEAAVLLAKVYFFTRRFKKAEEILRTSLKEDDENPYMLMWLGRTQLALRREGQAADIFRQILRRDPENYVARYYLGRSLESRDIKHALVAYHGALAVEYEASRIHAHLARLFGRLGMKDRAAKHQERGRLLALSQKQPLQPKAKDREKGTDR